MELLPTRDCEAGYGPAGAWLPWQPYENRETKFCVHCQNTPNTRVWLTYDVSFSSYIRSPVNPIRELEALPWQPDQNNVWILKVHDISFQVIYETHG